MTVLRAVVYEVCTQTATTLNEHMGRAAQQMAFALIAYHDRVRARQPALAALIHDSSELKPFTTSGLMQIGSVMPLAGRIAAGTRGWLRLTALNDALAEDFLTPMPIIELNRTLWRVERVIVQQDEHPWAGETSVQKLITEIDNAGEAHGLTLRFASPTAFRSKGNEIPLPVPSLIFHSLIERWNAAAPLQMPDLLTAFVEQMVTIEGYNAHTERIALKNGVWYTGFVGEVALHIAAVNSSLEKANPQLAALLSDDHDHLRHAVMLLAQFAFYSGVGIKTTQGMGLCLMPR